LVSVFTGMTNRVMLAAGTVVLSRPPDTDTSVSRVMVLVDVSCQRWLIAPALKRASWSDPARPWGGGKLLKVCKIALDVVSLSRNTLSWRRPAKKELQNGSVEVSCGP